MMLRSRLLILTALLFVSVAACSDDKDPATGDNDARDTTTLPDSGNDSVDTTPDTTDTTDTTPDTTDTTPDTTDTTDTVEACQDDSSFAFLGQLFDNDSDVPNGGCAVTTEPTADAGLAAVYAAVPADGCDFDAGACTVDSLSLQVTDAVVTATGIKTTNCDQSRVNFWVQDANASIQIKLNGENDDCASNVPAGSIPAGLTSIRVGDRISFTVETVQRNFKLPAVTGISDFSRTATDDDSVYVATVDEALTSDDIGRLVYLEGTTSSAGTSCGGSKECYEVTYANGAKIQYRTGDDSVPVGTGLQFLGIVSAFDDVQITNSPNAGNYDWGRFLSGN